MAFSKIFVFDDVAKHNAADDCWLIISEKVYDVTSFIAEHPGGSDVLESATGKDATVDFGDVGHSPAAKELMETYCIGRIDPSTLPKDGGYVKPQQVPKIPEEESKSATKMLAYLVPLAILALSFAIRHVFN